MLVATKYGFPEYDYNPRVKHYQKNVVNKKKNIKRQTANNIGRMIFTIMIFFALGFFIVLRHVNLTEMSNHVDEQKTQISSLEKINSQLKTETVVDLSKVDDIAKNKLNMDRPYKFQMVYVNLNEDVSLNNNQTSKEESEYKIVKSLNKVIEYFY